MSRRPLLQKVLSRDDNAERKHSAQGPPDSASGHREAFVEVRRLHKRFGDLEVLKEVDLSIRKGERVAIIGSSGSGKTTLLRCLNLLEEFESGEIHFDGRPIGYHYDRPGRPPVSPGSRAKVREQIGIVFQAFNLFPHVTVLENVTMAPVYVRRLEKQVAEQTARELLERVGLGEKAEEHPSKLSGGQQQRVAIARALAMEPKLMLFDEVTSALDPELVGEVLAVMRDLADSGMTMAIVTHELHFAKDVADRVLFFNDGRIEEQGTPNELFGNPKSPHLQRFIHRFTQNYFLE